MEALTARWYASDISKVGVIELSGCVFVQYYFLLDYWSMNSAFKLLIRD